jgi:hypothetical protein
MINTVPRSVTLTEVLVPLPAKPDALTAVHNADGSLTLVGRARVSHNNYDGALHMLTIRAHFSSGTSILMPVVLSTWCGQHRAPAPSVQAALRR